MRYVKPGHTKGAINIIGSKSVMQRAAACALLAQGESVISSPSLSDDGVASLNVIQALGANVEVKNDKVLVQSNGISNKINSNQISVNESGLSIRLFAPIIALFPGEFNLKGEGTLKNRSMKLLCDTLSQAGVTLESTEDKPPIKIRGPIRGGRYHYDGSTGSQVLSGLLTALPLCKEDSKIHCTNLTSKPYIDLTIQTLKDFGVIVEWDKEDDFIMIPGNQLFTPTEIKVEGDWSAASFFAVLGALSDKIIIRGLSENSFQGDKVILSVIKSIGANITYHGEEICISRGGKEPFIFDATDAPDLFPPLVVLASAINGTSRIKGSHRLKGKESDRAEVLVEEFSKIGVKLVLEDDEIIIHGEGKISGGEAFSHHDHRIAMALGIAGVISERGVSILGDECVSKSYPNFFENLESIRSI